MKWENNDLILKRNEHNEDTSVFRSVPLTPKYFPIDGDVEFHIETETIVVPTSEEIGRAFRIRDMSDFC